MTGAKPYVQRDEKISDGLLERLNQLYAPSENARLALIQELGELGSEMSDLQIYPEFELVVMTNEQELRLSWTADSLSNQMSLAYCMGEIQEALNKVVQAGLLPADGEIQPLIPVCILQDYQEYPYYLCLPEELKTLRRKAIQAVNQCFKNVRDFTPCEPQPELVPS